MHLAHDAEGEVLEVYGAEREVCILASTVQQLEYDGRFSFGNKAWAKGYEIPENVSRGMDMNADYVVNSHLAVLDELIGLVREVIWEQELGKKENMQINEETKGVIANGHFGTWHTAEISGKLTEPEPALNGQSHAGIEETALCYAQAQIDEMGLRRKWNCLAQGFMVAVPGKGCTTKDRI